MSATAETSRDVIARIRRNERERAYCLAVLDLWAKVQEQGIDIAGGVLRLRQQHPDGGTKTSVAIPSKPADG